MKANKVVASFAGATLMLLSALSAQAMPNIVDPPLGPEETNLLDGLLPGEHIRAGTKFGEHCNVTKVEFEDVPGAYLNRSEFGSYWAGNHVKEIDIVCQPGMTGVAYSGDNDRKGDPTKTLTVWYIDGVAWTPTEASNKWFALPLFNVQEIKILPGNSLFGTFGEARGSTDEAQSEEPVQQKLFLPLLGK